MGVPEQDEHCRALPGRERVRVRASLGAGAERIVPIRNAESWVPAAVLGVTDSDDVHRVVTVGAVRAAYGENAVAAVVLVERIHCRIGAEAIPSRPRSLCEM